MKTPSLTQCTVLWILFCLVLNPLYASVILDSSSRETESISLLKSSEVYIDTEGLTLEKILEQKRFKPYHEPYLNTGMRSVAVWIHFAVTNPSPDTVKRILVLSSPMLENIVLYRPNSTAPPLASGREHISSSSQKTCFYYFNISLTPQKTQHYYLKVNSLYSPVNFALTLQKKESYLQNDMSDQLIAILLMGVIAGLMFYNFLISLQTRDKSYFYYSLYLLVLIWHQMSYLGLTQIYMPHLFNQLDIQIPNIKSALVIIFSALFSMQFLKVSTIPILHRIYQFFIGAAIINVGISYLFGIKNMYVVAVLSIFYVTFVLIASIVSYRHGNTQARLFIAGFLLLFISYLFLAANALGLTSMMQSHRNIIVWSTALDAVILSLAFADRYMILRREKEATDSALLAASMQREALVQKEVTRKTSQLEEALHTKELLLQEIHHRVKNNLQVILSMIRLQSDEMAGNREAVEKFKNMEQRINAISKTYEMLLVAEDISHIDMEEYIETLLADIHDAFASKETEISFETTITAILPLKEAAYVGLIVNELVTNAYKHAFSNSKEGKIKISLLQTDTHYTLIVEDDGSGYDQKKGKTLGLKLIHTLVHNQLEGSMVSDTKRHSKYTIRFKL